MELTKNLNPFNSQMAELLKGTFAPNVEPFETKDGTLVFRGPVSKTGEPSHVGAHVAVTLDAEVRNALESASPADREEMTGYLLDSLRNSVQSEYDPANIKLDALMVIGKMRAIKG